MIWFFSGLAIGFLTNRWPIASLYSPNVLRWRLRFAKCHAKGACVYALFHRGRVAYVGHTSNIDRRISQHKRAKAFDYVRVVKCRNLSTARMLERHLIIVFQTAGECQLNKQI